MTEQSPPRPSTARRRPKNVSVWRPRWWVALVTILQVILGVGGFLHELLVTTGERPAILVFCAVLLGMAPIQIALERFRPQ